MTALRLWIATLVLTLAAYAGPSGCGSITRLTGKADYIVIGLVQARLVNRIADAQVAVQRVLKGRRGLGPIPVKWKYSPMWTDASKLRSVEGHGIFFLSREANGTWSVLPVCNGDVAWDEAYVTLPKSTSAERRKIIQSMSPKTSSVHLVLAEVVLARESGVRVRADLVAEFRQSRSQVLLAAFRRFMENPDATLRSVGLRGLIASGDAAVIAMVHRNHAQVSSTPAVVNEIKTHFSSTSPQTVRNLGELAIDVKVGDELRVAAAEALARVHTKESLPYLARLLNDSNWSLQWNACHGMARFANEGPHRTRETTGRMSCNVENVEFWRSWYVRLATSR